MRFFDSRLVTIATFYSRHQQDGKFKSHYLKNCLRYRYNSGISPSSKNQVLQVAPSHSGKRKD